MSDTWDDVLGHEKPSEDPEAPETDEKGRKIIRMPHGGYLVPGAGGGPQPGSGRPKNEFRAKMRELLDLKVEHEDAGEVPLWQPYLEECLQGKHGPAAFKSAMDFAADRGYGKVPNVNKVVGSGGEDEPLKIVVEHMVAGGGT